jgi:hypothetical protein
MRNIALVHQAELDWPDELPRKTQWAAQNIDWF